MRKLALALAAAAAVAFTAPIFAATDASAGQGVQRAATDISSGQRHRHAKKVIIRRDRGWHRGHHRHGWRHGHRHGGNKVVIIKKRVYR
jgi:hypothetical protein